MHAAAGGLGQKLTQLIKARGGTVIGIVSGAQKADTARRAGAGHIVLSTGDAFVEPVLDVTGGEGVDVVFDGGGETTFRASMSALRRHGLLLYYGAVLGAAPVVNMRELPRSIKISYRSSVTTSPLARRSCATAPTSSTWYGTRTSTLESATATHSTPQPKPIFPEPGTTSRRRSAGHGRRRNAHAGTRSLPQLP
ncbi:zinc-binding dehydrogenase [Streptomyces sp. NBC_00009]|uniref:zinc-binding dehydrogenase n=1 Tax=Streptomyces sp. NBC_00009 TaxID=2975620 RepID=UPI003244561D